MARLIFINRYFYPDHSATSQILSDLAFHLALSHEVHVVTSRQRYDHPAASLPAHELTRGVNVHRLSTTGFGRAGLAGRSVDYLSFYGSLHRRLIDFVQPGDIVTVKTDPPLAAAVAIGTIRRSGAHLVNWLQDLYPEVAAGIGMRSVGGWVGRYALRHRDRFLQAAAANVVVGERMAKRVAERGIARDRIHVIPNWTDDEAVRPIDPASNPLRAMWHLQAKFVVGYSGNLGRAHEFETILIAAEHLRSNRQIAFLMIGGGHHFDALRRHVSERGLLSSFEFRPYQDRAQLQLSLGVPDIHWISLRPGLEGLVVPSKFYGIAAAGRPMVMIGAGDGEFAQLIARHDCGLVVEPGNGAALAQALLALSRDRARCTAMGRQARAMLDAQFTRRQGFARWCELLKRIESATASTVAGDEHEP